MQEGQGGEGFGAGDVDEGAAQVRDERLEVFVAGNDVEGCLGAFDDGAAQVMGEDKIEGVAAGGADLDEADAGRVAVDLGDEARIEFRLVFSDEQGDENGQGGGGIEIDGGDVFEIDEDEMRGGGGRGSGHGEGVTERLGSVAVGFVFAQAADVEGGEGDLENNQSPGAIVPAP